MDIQVNKRIKKHTFCSLLTDDNISNEKILWVGWKCVSHDKINKAGTHPSILGILYTS